MHDPYVWGAIAAANAFSDVYAMGGRPLLSLNLVGWPEDLDFELLARVLEGGADKATEAGASVVGGHTVEDREPKYGMAVTGVVHPDRLVRSSSAAPGMSLLLTKPLSMGIVSTALKREAAPEALVAEATAVMATLNAGAAEAMLEVGAPAATDVTGFGLLGHLHGLGRLSGVSAEVWAGAVPVLDGVAALAEAGMVPGGTWVAAIEDRAHLHGYAAGRDGAAVCGWQHQDRDRRCGRGCGRGRGRDALAV